jgi:DNA repair protein RecN (Recombination protein N)
MLTYINIKNFAIIKELELDLQPEMTVLTGETGAGKSIIIDTLELALGARADTALVRKNTDRCEITLMFDLTNLSHVRDLLIEQELDSENECIIRRIISGDGRSKSSINGNSCTQQTLRTISTLLLDIHGQHEHQALINSERQRELLDAFASCKSLANKVKQLYNTWLKIKKELIELENYAEDYQTKIDFLNYQLKELESFDFSAENLEKLRTEQKRFSNTKQIASSLDAALNIITENESGSVISGLYNAKNKLEKYKDIEPSIVSTLNLLQHAIIHAQEATANIRQNLNSVELNEEKQKQVEEQLAYIHDLAYKHQVPPTELSQVRINLEQQLKNLQNIGSQLETAKTAAKEAEKSYLEAANELSSKRKSAAIKLDQLVTTKMQLLGMIGGKFAINFQPNINKDFGANGLEKIEFLVSANPGQPLHPLSKVASGGELSRISLAIQVITAEKEVTSTLIFDEIDAGIGGKTAEIVGQLLRKLSQKTQIICITHLPQIAAQGHNHILIEKISKANDTVVKLTTLNQHERIDEIARMLGGIKITQQTLAHAKEILNAAI